MGGKYKNRRLRLKTDVRNLDGKQKMLQFTLPSADYKNRLFHFCFTKNVYCIDPQRRIKKIKVKKFALLFQTNLLYWVFEEQILYLKSCIVQIFIRKNIYLKIGVQCFRNRNLTYPWPFRTKSKRFGLGCFLDID